MKLATYKSKLIATTLVVVVAVTLYSSCAPRYGCHYTRSSQINAIESQNVLADTLCHDIIFARTHRATVSVLP